MPNEYIILLCAKMMSRAYKKRHLSVSFPLNFGMCLFHCLYVPYLFFILLFFLKVCAKRPMCKKTKPGRHPPRMPLSRHKARNQNNSLESRQSHAGLQNVQSLHIPGRMSVCSSLDDARMFNIIQLVSDPLTPPTNPYPSTRTLGPCV